jgi:hypothetical protein
MMGRLLLRLAAMPLLLGLAAATASEGLVPGQWQTTSVLQVKAMPNAPPQVAALFAQAAAKPTISTVCVTAAQLRDDPQRILRSRPNCRTSRFVMAGGRYEVDSVCTDRDGSQLAESARGTYTPMTFASTVELTGISGPSAHTRLSFKLDGRRLAACNG